jgi:hypothetical protein
MVRRTNELLGKHGGVSSKIVAMPHKRIMHKEHYIKQCDECLSRVGIDQVSG